MTCCMPVSELNLILYVLTLFSLRLSTAPEKTKYEWTFKLTHIQPEKRKYFFSAHSEKELTVRISICFSGFRMSGKLTALTYSTDLQHVHWNGFPLFSCVSSNHDIQLRLRQNTGTATTRLRICRIFTHSYKIHFILIIQYKTLFFVDQC
jgi:hypothetical protein